MTILRSLYAFLSLLSLVYGSPVVTKTVTATTTIDKCSIVSTVYSKTVTSTFVSTAIATSTKVETLTKSVGATSTAYTTVTISETVSPASSSLALSSYDPHIYTSTTTYVGSSYLPSSVVYSASSVVSASSGLISASSKPVVDLAYALHSAQTVDSYQGTTYYNFSNIRYAAPPTGSLRFLAPEDPVNNRSAGVQDGFYGKICPQAYTPWQNSALVTADPGELESEDCLFLDVVVAKDTWENRHFKKVPVIVWIHGGGYQIGAKYGTPNSDPRGLLDRSYADAEGAIWIGFNYRLGAFGFLQGPTFQGEGGQANAGFYDQRKALDWIQKYVSLFGGDPNRVTAMGESAGGGSILHHITAYGGQKDSAPINKAVLQSPAFVPRPLESQAEDSYQILLDTAGVRTLTELKALSTYDLQKANKLSQESDFYGVFQFGPGPDGDYVPDLPGYLLARGEFDKTIPVLTAHNTEEGYKYTDSSATNNSAFDTYMLDYFPDISRTDLAIMSDVLYPPVYDGRLGLPYTSAFERLMTAISEFTFTCNAYWTARDLGPALGRNSYSYLFSVPPGTHTLDVYYTYYVSPTVSTTVVNATLAEIMQGYITSFAQDGNPNRNGLPEFPLYEWTSTQQNLNQTFIGKTHDPSANARCDWWQLFLRKGW